MSAVVNFIGGIRGGSWNRPRSGAGALIQGNQRGQEKSQNEEGEVCFYYSSLSITCCGNYRDIK